VLNLSDGTHGLAEIAKRAGVPFATIKKAAELLLARGLLREVSG
jgi:aminopeptidase-like protein